MPDDRWQDHWSVRYGEALILVLGVVLLLLDFLAHLDLI